MLMLAELDLQEDIGTSSMCWYNCPATPPPNDDTTYLQIGRLLKFFENGVLSALSYKK